jgi:two-component system chemotaxis response regulator CheY
MADVLVVDDAQIMRINVKRMLEKLGHHIIGKATTAYDAINAYKAHRPDFVTMDITMPEKNNIKDGIEAVKRIIEIDKTAKIIMITSHGEQDKVIRAIQSGASNYILKPLQIDKLKDVISKLKLT